MEDLIADHPGDFFPRKRLTLIGRQKTFPGVGRFDLMFKDEFDSNILMELKARPAKYKDATQLAKDRDALVDLGRKGIIMWLVAPVIPMAVREFLDRIGIEYSEIHEVEFRRVAEKHNYVFASEVAYSDSRRNSSSLFVKAEELEPVTPLLVESSSVNNADCGNSFDRLPSRIQGKFRKKRDELEKTFQAAYLFLLYPEVADTDIVLMTASNAHLYFRKCFLTYIKLDSSSITLSPKYNKQIHSEAENRPSLLFGKILPELIEKHKGYADKWVRPHRIGIGRKGNPIYEYTFFNRTPVEFFEAVIIAIENLNS